MRRVEAERIVPFPQQTVNRKDYLFGRYREGWWFEQKAWPRLQMRRIEWLWK